MRFDNCAVLALASIALSGVISVAEGSSNDPSAAYGGDSGGGYNQNNYYYGQQQQQHQQQQGRWQGPTGQ
jgi:hypothetical protein